MQTPVEEVKRRLEELSGTSAATQKLIYLGKVLQDGQTLGFYNIKNQNTIHMVQVKNPLPPQIQQQQQSSSSAPPPAGQQVPGAPINVSGGFGFGGVINAMPNVQIQQPRPGSNFVMGVLPVGAEGGINNQLNQIIQGVLGSLGGIPALNLSGGNLPQQPAQGQAQGVPVQQQQQQQQQAQGAQNIRVNPIRVNINIPVAQVPQSNQNAPAPARAPAPPANNSNSVPISSSSSSSSSSAGVVQPVPMLDSLDQVIQGTSAQLRIAADPRTLDAFGDSGSSPQPHFSSLSVSSSVDNEASIRNIQRYGRQLQQAGSCLRQLADQLLVLGNELSSFQAGSNEEGSGSQQPIDRQLELQLRQRAQNRATSLVPAVHQTSQLLQSATSILSTSRFFPNAELGSNQGQQTLSTISTPVGNISVHMTSNTLPVRVVPPQQSQQQQAAPSPASSPAPAPQQPSLGDMMQNVRSNTSSFLFT